MSIAIVTGSAGLIGAEAVRFFTEKGMDVVGIDNDMRRVFFGDEAQHRMEPAAARDRNPVLSPRRWRHPRSGLRIEAVFALWWRDRGGDPHCGPALARLGGDASRRPISVNANGTLNLLEATRRHCPNAVVHLHQHQQGLWRHARTRCRWSSCETRWEIEPRPSLCRTRHRREHEHRPDACTACSAPRRSRPTCWCRSTAAISV